MSDYRPKRKGFKFKAQSDEAIELAFETGIVEHPEPNVTARPMPFEKVNIGKTVNSRREKLKEEFSKFRKAY